MKTLSKLLTVAVLFFLGGLSAAESPKKVSWYQPFHFVPVGTNRAQVVLFGKTKPGLTISVDMSQVVSANAVEATSDKGAQIETTASDSSGFFQMTLSLPMGIVQVPVNVAASAEEQSTFVLPFQVSLSETNLMIPASKDESAITDWREKARIQFEARYGAADVLIDRLRGNWLNVGLGYNYQLVELNTTGGTKIKSSSPAEIGGSLGATRITNSWMYRGSYVIAPGSIKNLQAGVSATKSDYIWHTISAEGGYNLNLKNWRQKVHISLLGGLERQSVPHFSQPSPNVLESQTVQILSLSAGAAAFVALDQKWTLEGFLRLQQPIMDSSSESRLDVKAKTGFDGSIGALWQYKEKRYWGVAWFGQWLNYNFSYHDVATQTSQTGKESLFYTNLEVRHIWKF